MPVQRIRGLESQKPVLLAAELYLAEDTEKLFIGTSSGIDVVIKKSDLFYLKTEADALLAAKQNLSNKGIANGYAGLDSAGKVPSAQLPSFVDDVLEFANLAAFPVTGETGKIYIALDTNLTYRWGGTVYVEISQSLALGETLTTAYRGDRGKTAYDHSQLVHDKNLVGLASVDNTSDVNKPVSTAQQTALNLKVDLTDARLTDQRTPLDGSVTYLKFISSLKAWQYANGYEADAELISRHRWLPNNYSVLDAHNNYHQMVEINRKNWDSTNEFAAATIHDAFMVGGVQKRLFIGKGPVVDDGLGNPVTWLDRIPMVSKNFDQELAACAALNNGTTITGFHQMTLPEWALLMQIIKNSGVIVRGNNNWGQDVNDKSVTFHLGVPAAFNDHVSDGKHYTGSGGTKTSHNNQLDGIYDLTGGIWRRIAGCRIVNGEIQIINQNDAANSSLDQTDASTLWRAILEDGTLVAPSTVNTLKFSVNGNITKAAPAAISSSKAFDSIGCEADVLATSAGIALLKKIGLYPYTTGMGGTFWFNTSGVFVPLGGAAWNNTTDAAVPALNCLNARADANWSFGFRAAFVGSL